MQRHAMECARRRDSAIYIYMCVTSHVTDGVSRANTIAPHWHVMACATRNAQRAVCTPHRSRVRARGGRTTRRLRRAALNAVYIYIYICDIAHHRRHHGDITAMAWWYHGDVTRLRRARQHGGVTVTTWWWHGDATRLTSCCAAPSEMSAKEKKSSVCITVSPRRGGDGYFRVVKTPDRSFLPDEARTAMTPREW